jgi:hypothetical protein
MDSGSTTLLRKTVTAVHDAAAERMVRIVHCVAATNTIITLTSTTTAAIAVVDDAVASGSRFGITINTTADIVSFAVAAITAFVAAAVHTNVIPTTITHTIKAIVANLFT